MMRQLLILVSILAIITCLPTSLAPSADEAPAKKDLKQVVGCYEVNLGKWEPQLAIGKDEAYITPPKLVELTNSPSAFREEGGPAWCVVRPLQVSASHTNPYGQWSIRSDGAVVISWSNGFSGLSAVLFWDGKRYVGTAGTFWDFPRNAQQATMSLLPVACKK